MALPARDKALRAVQQCCEDAATLEDLLRSKLANGAHAETEAAALAAEVERLSALQQAEVQHQLATAAAQSPPARPGPTAPTSPGHWAAGFAASLPQGRATAFQEWMRRMPALEAPPVVQVDEEEPLDPFVDSGMAGTDPYAGVL